MSAGASGTHVLAPSFEEQLTPLLERAFRMAVGLVGDRSEAEDMVQEAALRAFRAFDSFEPGTNFRAWFFRILVNCCYGRHRQARRRPQTVNLDDASDFYLLMATKRMGIWQDTPDPAAVVLGSMQSEQVMAAIVELPEEYRSVATLYFLEDMSYEEIAEALGIPIGTVRSRLHRGRRMLQKALWHVALEAGLVVAPVEGASP